MHDDWRRTLSEMHDPQTCPIIRTPNDQPFAVGCVLCKSHSTERKKDPWANFRISSKSNLQIGHMKRHVQSRLHREACKKLGIKLIEQIDRDDRVPKASSWLWSLTTCFTYASMLDYEKFLQCDDAVKLGLTGDPDMSPVWTGKKRRTCKQITTCIGSVIDDHEQSLMRASCRCAFSVDDADQTRIMRFRLVAANPVVQYRDIIGSVLRDAGHSIPDTANAIMEGIEQACVVRRGPVCRKLWTCPEEVDQDLLAHLKKITISGASDGHEVEVQAIQAIASDKRLPLRYQWRDLVHTSRGSYQSCIKWLRPSDTELIDVLIAGPASFAKRVQYSRAFAKKWVETQKSDVQAIYQVCENLSYSEVRYCSRSKPMSRFIMLWPSCLKVLVLVSNDTTPAHANDVKWAKAIIKLTTGPSGFIRMSKFCVEADFFVACNLMTSLQQGADSDVAIGQGQVIECLERLQAMFQEGFIFSVERNESYTWEWLNGVKDLQTLYFGSGDVTTVGWSTSQSALEKPIKFAKELYQMAFEFVNMNFPCWTWRAKFACFDNGPSKLAQQERLDSFEAIVKKELPCSSSAVAREAFFEVLPLVNKFYNQYRDNKRAWCSALEKLRARVGGADFKPRMKDLVYVTLTYLSLQDNTNDVERLFRRVNLIESKGRSRHHGLYFLRDSLKIGTQCSPDLALYQVPLGEEDEKCMKATLAFPQPHLLLHLAKRKYVELFASDASSNKNDHEFNHLRKARLKQRSLDGMQFTFRLKRKLGEPAKVSQDKRAELWCGSVKAMVEKMKEEKFLPKEQRVRTLLGEFDRTSSNQNNGAQRKMLREMHQFNGITEAEHTNEESTAGCARPIKPFKPKTKRPKLARREKSRPNHAASKAADASKAAVEKREREMSLRQRKGEKAQYADIQPTTQDVNWLAKLGGSSSSSRPGGQAASSSTDRPPPAMPSGSSRDDVPVAQKLRVHRAHGWSPALHEMLMYNTAVGGDAWQKLDRKIVACRDRASASLIVVPGSLANQLKCSPASLHCRVFGKTLVSQSFLDGSPTEPGPVCFKPLGAELKGRLRKLDLYISKACSDKHNKVLQEMLDIGDSTSITKLYSFTVNKDADPSVVVEHFRQLSGRNDFAYRNVRWIVQKHELDPSRNALAQALSKQFKTMMQYVDTMSNFVSDLGNTASPI